MPQHCDIFFNAAELQEEGKYGHSVTALGYSEDSDVGEFWVLSNNWGEGRGRQHQVCPGPGPLRSGYALRRAGMSSLTFDKYTENIKTVCQITERSKALEKKTLILCFLTLNLNRPGPGQIIFFAFLSGC